MSQVRILLRWSLLVTVAFVFTVCSSNSGVDGSGGTQFRGNPCRGGAGKADRNAPIVCVDDSGATLSVDPDPFTVHSYGESDHQPVMIHWWTRSGGNTLSMQMGPGCVTEVNCNGGHCSARTIPTVTAKTCKYDVWTDRHPRLDPEITIDPCCPGP